MKNETKESQNTARASVVINIHGGNNQILPNATEVVQNFYGAEFAHVRTQNNGMEEKEEDEAVRIARGTLWPVAFRLNTYYTHVFRMWLVEKALSKEKRQAYVMFIQNGKTGYC